MKLGAAIYTYLWLCPLEEAIDRVARLGFTQIEAMTTSPHLWPDHFGPYERQRLKRRLHDAGVELVAVNPTYLDINMSSMNAAIRQASVREIQANLELAHDLGARTVVVMPGRRHALIPAPFEDVWSVAMEGVSACVRVAERLGVTFGLEHGPSLFVQTVADAIRMVQEVNSPACRMVYDVANAQVVEPPVPALRQAAPYLAHLHLSDTRLDKWGHLAVGEGAVDFAALTEAVRAIDYQGPTILEVIDQSDPDGAMVRSLATLQKLGWTL